MVKEEILSRLGELGVRVENGCVTFQPVLLRRSEMRRSPGTWRSFAVDGTPVEMSVPEGTLAFSLCQVPVRYHLRAEREWIRVVMRDGSSREFDGRTLDTRVSAAVFARRGVIAQIEVGVLERALRTV